MLLLISLSWISSESYSALVLSYSSLAALRSLAAIRDFSSHSFREFLISSLSIKNALTSLILRSCLSLRYSLAFSDCFSSGPTCFSSSFSISLTRTRFSLSFSSFLIEAAFLLLNLTIPAASSKSSLLSSGRPLNILSICPCPIIE